MWSKVTAKKGNKNPGNSCPASMAVMLETSRGDMVIDLFTEDCPKATQNFLKLCAIKYYNNVIFHQVQHNFVVQTGDPDGTGRGGSSIWG